MRVDLNLTDFLFLSPLLILVAGALITLLIASFCQKNRYSLSFFVALATFLFSLVATNVVEPSNHEMLTDWLKVDQLSLFFTNLFLIAGILTTLLSHSFFQKFELVEDEFYFLLIASVFGLILIGASADFLTLFIGLETLSLSLYILCGYVKKWLISRESAIKYFLLSSLGTAFFLYGVALIFSAIGSTNFEDLLPGYLSLDQNAEIAIFLAGIAFITIGLLFKATVVPFHSWVPDVYEGASTPLVAFMAVGTKTAAFAALIRIFLEAMPEFNTVWNDSLALLFFPTLLLSNLIAIKQTNARRFFAYSGISHSGYLLIPLAASQADSITSILYYLLVYAIATFGAFAVFSILDKEKKGLSLDDLKGLFFKSPFLASVLTLSLLTLAGIPPTVGFLAKFFVFKVGFDAGYYGLVIFGLAMTVVSAYYYLSIITRMLRTGDELEEVKSYNLNSSALRTSTFVGALSLGAILLFSLFPELLYNLIP